jgi:peptidoglycan hydrolase-like protein with peptidoglycan-binding domain
MRARRIRAAVLGILVALATGSVGWWAGQQALTTPDDGVTARPALTVAVAEHTVHRTLNVAVAAEREAQLLARNTAGGMVTEVAVDGAATVDVGDTLFRVDERPIVVAEGAIPFYRDLQAGARGRDVAQLQGLLAALGHFEGAQDGVFGAGTRAAVRAWERELELSPSGVVPLGMLVAVPSLPADVALADDLLVGAVLGGREKAVHALAAEPAFTLVLGADQRGLVPLDADVVVAYGGEHWPARMTDAAENQNGELEVRLAGPSGPVCGDRCAEAVPGSDRVTFPAEVVVVPETTGPAVPVGAIQTTPDGDATVRLADGSVRSVEVRASVRGMAVVEGLEVGEEVELEPAAEGGGDA